MIILQGERVGCENCIRGHRAADCQHLNKPLVTIKGRGKPLNKSYSVRLKLEKNVVVIDVTEEKVDTKNGRSREGLTKKCFHLHPETKCCFYKVCSKDGFTLLGPVSTDDPFYNTYKKNLLEGQSIIVVPPSEEDYNITPRNRQVIPRTIHRPGNIQRKDNRPSSRYNSIPTQNAIIVASENPENISNLQTIAPMPEFTSIVENDLIAGGNTQFNSTGAQPFTIQAIDEMIAQDALPSLTLDQGLTEEVNTQRDGLVFDSEGTSPLTPLDVIQPTQPVEQSIPENESHDIQPNLDVSSWIDGAMPSANITSDEGSWLSTLGLTEVNGVLETTLDDFLDVDSFN